MKAPLNELMDSFKTLYANGEYSDLTIQSTEKSYSVHKAIVCSRSNFFAAAVRGGFKEAHEGTINLPDDDPRIVDMMIGYFYHFDYEVQQDEDSPESGLVLTTHAKVYCIGEKYLINGLKALALEKFEAVIRSRGWDPSDLLEAAEQAYTYTTEADRGLKDAVISTLCSESYILDRDEAKETLKVLNMLTYDIVMYLHQQGNV